MPKKEEIQVHGTSAPYLIEKITRDRIYESIYWKEECFALDASTVINRAVELDHIGGIYGERGNPTNFICLLLKLLQIQPSLDIIKLYINNEEYKYLTALGAMYLRLTGTPVEIYTNLEPLYSDFRKLRQKTDTGYKMVYMDEFIDILLTEKYYLGISFPHLDSRALLESKGLMEPRVISEDVQAMLDEEEERQRQEEEEERKRQEEEKKKQEKERDRDYSKKRYRSSSRDHSRERRRRRRSYHSRSSSRSSSDHHSRHSSHRHHSHRHRDSRDSY